ncbi:MAG: leucyl/phenylalanyl-tRNA--protein transferase [Bacteroidota bacterium]|jgi:leucyl/phenylalanyl-tRNA--protein transferase
MSIYILSRSNILFPPVEKADGKGLLAAGGDLSPERLLAAYRQGIFPWYNPGSPILWWSPDPRFVLFPSELKVSRSMRPYLNQGRYQVTMDRAFEAVIVGCQRSELGPWRTWITEDMRAAYEELHRLGHAHSVEVWEGAELVGGLYGLVQGRCFFGESMFTRASNASKYGFIHLVRMLERLGFWLVDCQQETGHLASLGARAIPRREFKALLERNEAEPTLSGSMEGWEAEAAEKKVRLPF